MQLTSNFQVYSASAGSGKTFTLVKEYLKILLSDDNPFKFQQILAVTFTNKAAGEMKERIIENLNDFASNKSNDLLLIICKELQVTEKLIFSKSKQILGAILQNYSAFSVTTIDSFTHKLVKTFAFDLKLPLNFEVEMDAVSLLNEAVELMISKIGEDRELTKVLVNYSLQNIDDDKDWDISKSLKNFVKIILNENNAAPLESLKNLELNWFVSLKKELIATNKKIVKEFETIGNKALEQIKRADLEIADFAYSGELPNHFNKLSLFKLKHDTVNFEGRLNKYFEEKKHFYAGKCSSIIKEKIDQLMPDLEIIYNQSKKMFLENYSNYVRNLLLAESLTQLAVLNSIYQSLTEIKTENNILLHSEFNRLISDSIKDEPAPFIYERIGEKYRYYFIDEMQDTSVLQWENSIPLVENAITSENELGETGKLMLVGDAKQSIYRWRGGKAEQFINLSSKNDIDNLFKVAKKVENLDTNFRSYSQIINFNNSFFTFAASFLTNNEYKNLYVEGSKQLLNKKSGGYVQFDFVDKTDDEEEDKDLVYPKKVYEIIKNLDGIFDKSEICVLVRKNNQGVEIANYLTLNKIDVISSESLLIKNNKKVNFIITIFQILDNPLGKDFKLKALYFLYDYLLVQKDKHEFFEETVHLNNFNFFNSLRQFKIIFSEIKCAQLALYEMAEYCIQAFKLTETSDAYLQFFLDVIFEFQQKNGSDLNGFLEFWELKNEKYSIVAPEAKDSVRIMTIHKAKGLEFPVVIFPYDIDIYYQQNPKVWYNFDHMEEQHQLLINYSTKLNSLGEQGVQLFLKQREELELDNFNILYVALTRAKEQLYIVSEFNKKGKEIEDKLKKTSGLFIQYLKSLNSWQLGKTTYSFGNKNRLSTPKLPDTGTITHKKLISNSLENHQVVLATSSSLLWGTEQGNAINNGNLWHEILAKIKTESDISEVVASYYFKGILNESEKNQIESYLEQLINHPKIAIYFSQNYEVKTEQEIVIENRAILIPDRLCFMGNKVTIIDYKTGTKEMEHRKQLETYAQALEKMNYTVENKILIYIGAKITIEEI
ncbi:exodeoxyribonuclease V subunit beta [Lutibacter sp.]|uniref:UvrD-helicase domain-containing protein n=1 Tax=Lutibacter sp. TaxID=1925666 RepID=UPI0027332066|nr:UvrD-helicase domain-containing protein [Lutibacter sp.]MDP3313155.1 UvrD-helicase domain-containing protein [Lutibacter sp.]